MASTRDPNADGRVSHTPTAITSAAYLAEATLQWRRRASDPSDCLPAMVMQPLARREETLDAAGGNSPTIRSSVTCGVAGMLTNLPGMQSSENTAVDGFCSRGNGNKVWELA